MFQVPADEVCGCPLVKDVFEPTGEFCRVSKRKCNKHYCWEKLRRAEVDLERVRVVTKSERTGKDLETLPPGDVQLKPVVLLRSVGGLISQTELL